MALDTDEFFKNVLPGMRAKWNEVRPLLERHLWDPEAPGRPS